MIHIEKDQKILENENMRVASPTGDYNDFDLIEFYDVQNEEVVGAYHAQYIQYGSMVYRYTDPKELGVEILKIDPESNHSAASLVRMQNELLKQFDQGSLEPESLQQVMEEEQVKAEEKISENENIEKTTEEEIEDVEDVTSEEEQETAEDVTGSVEEEGENNETGNTETQEEVIENNEESLDQENIEEGVVPPADVVNETIIDNTPEENTETSLPEDVVSFVKRKISKRITKTKKRV